LFKGVPSPFQATRYHSLVVEDIPDELIVNARAEDGFVMGFRHASLPIHGVQFHPESIATEHGHQLLANFLELAGLKAKALA
jgi:anthranilate synthase component 2